MCWSLACASTFIVYYPISIEKNNNNHHHSFSLGSLVRSFVHCWIEICSSSLCFDFVFSFFHFFVLDLCWRSNVPSQWQKHTSPFQMHTRSTSIDILCENASTKKTREREREWERSYKERGTCVPDNIKWKKKKKRSETLHEKDEENETKPNSRMK